MAIWRHILAILTALLVGACGAGLAGRSQLDLAKYSARLGVELGFMDHKVRPQDDLYRFVNGRWLSVARVPADRSSFGTFAELASQTDEALYRIIRRLAEAPEDTLDADQRKIRNLYLSLADGGPVEALGLSPLNGLTDKIAALDSIGALSRIFAELQATGLSAPLELLVMPDYRDTSVNVGHLDQSGLGLPTRGYYFPEDADARALLAGYEAYIAKILRLAGEADAATRAAAILALETRLARGHWPPVRLRNREKMYNPAAPGDLARMAPNMDWGAYFEGLGVGPPGSLAEPLIVHQPDYLIALDGALGEFSLAVWRDYLLFHLLDDTAGLLPAAFSDASFDFYQRRLRGVQEPRPRGRRAASMVNLVLGDALGRIYVAEHFTSRSRQRMEKMVGNLTAAFRSRLARLDWMGPETRARALEKLSELKVKVGYPDAWHDYAGIVIRADDAIGNLLRAGEGEWRRSLAKLGRPVDRDEWAVPPQLVNAFYNAAANEIVFPAGILQPPFFNPGADEAVNYGAIGAVIGHEISHAFDDQGRKSDGRGNLADWWHDVDEAEFEQRASALARQFEGYQPLAHLPLDGRLTLGENIGDLGGLVAAYDAYRLSLGEQRPKRIMGFSGAQRFFIGWAQIWRRIYTDEELHRRLVSDTHPPGEYRVNGIVVNLAAFYEAFDVGEGDAMYLPPGQRVTIW